MWFSKRNAGYPWGFYQHKLIISVMTQWPLAQWQRRICTSRTLFGIWTLLFGISSTCSDSHHCIFFFFPWHALNIRNRVHHSMYPKPLKWKPLGIINMTPGSPFRPFLCLFPWYALLIYFKIISRDVASITPPWRALHCLNELLRYFPPTYICSPSSLKNWKKAIVPLCVFLLLKLLKRQYRNIASQVHH